MVSAARPKLRIEDVRIEALEPDPKNPRRHPERQIKQIARSIQSFGFNVPLIVDEANKVIVGHGRLLAAKNLGLVELPVIRLRDLTPAQARAFAIADNRLTENSSWDDRLLGEIFLELSSMDLDFRLEDTGFSIPEIDLRIEGLSANENEPDSADELPAMANNAISAPGDLWQLGKHRLLCADAREPSSYSTLMQGELAHIVFTDSPYNVPIAGHVSGKGSIEHRDFAMAVGELTAGQFIHFLSTVVHLLVRHSVDGSLHFLCMDWRHVYELLKAGRQAYSELKNICIWVKHNAGMGSLYRSQHEFVLVFKNGKGAHRNNVELGRYGRNRTNVWNYPAINNFGRKGEEGNLLALHPTVKPVALVADALLDASGRGDVVLDGFLGSGSTLIAAERIGRVCYGMEIDPIYVDTALRRWQRYTGEVAIHADSHIPFDELAARKSVNG